MTILQADGRTEATLRGLDLRTTLQTAALKGPAHAVNRRKEGRKPNTRKRPKNINTARRRAPRTNQRSATCLKGKGQFLPKESPEDPLLDLIPLQISIIHHLVGDGGPRCLSETRGPTLDPTHPVSPDLEGDPGLIQGPEALLGLEVEVCLDPDLGPIQDPGLDQGQDQDPGTDQGLQPERGVHPDHQDREKLASPKQTP